MEVSKKAGKSTKPLLFRPTSFNFFASFPAQRRDEHQANVVSKVVFVFGVGFIDPQNLRIRSAFAVCIGGGFQEGHVLFIAREQEFGQRDPVIFLIVERRVADRPFAIGSACDASILQKTTVPPVGQARFEDFSQQTAAHLRFDDGAAEGQHPNDVEFGEGAGQDVVYTDGAAVEDSRIEAVVAGIEHGVGDHGACRALHLTDHSFPAIERFFELRDDRRRVEAGRGQRFVLDFFPFGDHRSSGRFVGDAAVDAAQFGFHGAGAFFLVVAKRVHINGFGVRVGFGNGDISHFFKMIFVLVSADDKRDFRQRGRQFFIVFNRQVGKCEHYIAFGFQFGKVAFGRIQVITVFRPGFAACVDEDAEDAEVEGGTIGIFQHNNLVVRAWFGRTVAVFEEPLHGAGGVRLCRFQPDISPHPSKIRLVEPRLEVGQIVVIELVVAEYRPIEAKGIEYIYHLFAPDALAVVSQGADDGRTDEVTGQHRDGIRVARHQFFPDRRDSRQTAYVVGGRRRYFVHIVDLQDGNFNDAIVFTGRGGGFFSGIAGKKTEREQEEKGKAQRVCFHGQYFFEMKMRE